MQRVYTLLGCEECANAWLDGADGLSRCLQCNEPRRYASTFKLKGKDAFLVGVRGLIKCDENNSKKKKAKSSVEFTGFSVHLYLIQNCSCFQCCCLKINYFTCPV